MYNICHPHLYKRTGVYSYSMDAVDGFSVVEEIYLYEELLLEEDPEEIEVSIKEDASYNEDALCSSTTVLYLKDSEETVFMFPEGNRNCSRGYPDRRTSILQKIKKMFLSSREYIKRVFSWAGYKYASTEEYSYARLLSPTVLAREDTRLVGSIFLLNEYLKNIIQKKILSNLSIFDHREAYKEVLVTPSTVYAEELTMAYLEKENNRIYSRHIKSPFRLAIGTLGEKSREFIKLIEKVIFPNSTDREYLIDMIILLASSFYMDGVIRITNITNHKDILSELERIATILYVNIQYSKFIVSSRRIFQKEQEIGYLYEYFEELKRILDVKTGIYITNGETDGSSRVGYVRFGRITTEIFDLLRLFGRLTVEEIKEASSALQELEDVERRSLAVRDCPISLEEFTSLVDKYSIKDSLFMKKLTLSSFQDRISIYRIVDGTLRIGKRTSNNRYRFLKEKLSLEALQKYERFDNAIKVINLMFHRMHMAIRPNDNTRSICMNHAASSYSQNRERDGTIRYNKKIDSRIKRYTTAELDTDVYTKKILSLALGSTKETAQPKIAALSNLRMFESTWMFFGMSIIPVMHLLLFISLWRREENDLPIYHLIEYYAHLGVNIVFSFVLCIYALRKIRKSYRHKKKHSFAYSLIRSGILRNRFILLYACLFLVSLSTTAGTTTLLALHRKDFALACQNILQIGAGVINSAEVKFLLVSRGILMLIGLCTSVVSIIGEFKENGTRWVRKIEKGLLWCSLLMFPLYLAALGYSSMHEVPYKKSSFQLVMYNYHIGLAFFIAGLIWLNLYTKYIYMRSESRILSLSVLRSLWLYVTSLIAFLTIIILISGVASVFFIYKNVFSLYSFMSEIEKKEIVLPDIIIPIP